MSPSAARWSSRLESNGACVCMGVRLSPASTKISPSWNLISPSYPGLSLTGLLDQAKRGVLVQGDHQVTYRKTNVSLVELRDHADTATYLARQDQAAHLRSLKSKVLAEVKFLLDAESSAESWFTETKFICGPLTFAITAFIKDLHHHKNPADKALKAAGETISKKLPFGEVVIAIGKGGIPEDVKVVPISALARESKTTEAEVRTTIIGRGYFLITQEAFAATIDKIEKLVLDGALSLPLPVTEFKKRIPPIILRISHTSSGQ